MRDIRIPVHREPARGLRTIKAWCMKSEARHINKVAFRSNYHALAFDRVSYLPGHNQPEFARFRMIVPLVFRIQWRQVLLRSINEIARLAIVLYYALRPRRVLHIVLLRKLLKCDVRFIIVFVNTRCALDLNGYPAITAHLRR